MEDLMNAVDPPLPQAAITTDDGRPIYYISNRPEAYEIGAEVGHDEAILIASLIAERATMAFPHIEFRVDGVWHFHPRGTEVVTAYIESRWQEWVKEAVPGIPPTS